MNYKLINKQTKEEHICQKVTIDGFDYYVSDEKLKVKDKFYFEVDGVSDILEVESEFHLERISGYLENKKVIATNNPNIDIPKMVDEVEELAEKAWGNSLVTKGHRIGFKYGYNKSQETHPFSEEDMIEFANWIGEEWSPNGRKECWDSNELNSTHEPKYLVDGTKELLQLWKEQKLKIIYYE